MLSKILSNRDIEISCKLANFFVRSTILTYNTLLSVLINRYLRKVYNVALNVILLLPLMMEFLT